MAEYNDKIIAPCAERVEAAFNRYLILGKFAEIQMIAPGSESKTMYHAWYRSDLVDPITITIERLTFKTAKVTRKDNASGPEDVKGKQLYALTKEVSYILPITAKTGDADLISALEEAHYKNVKKLGVPIFGWSDEY